MNIKHHGPTSVPIPGTNPISKISTHAEKKNEPPSQVDQSHSYILKHAFRGHRRCRRTQDPALTSSERLSRKGLATACPTRTRTTKLRTTVAGNTSPDKPVSTPPKAPKRCPLPMQPSRQRNPEPMHVKERRRHHGDQQQHSPSGRACPQRRCSRMNLGPEGYARPARNWPITPGGTGFETYAWIVMLPWPIELVRGFEQDKS